MRVCGLLMYVRSQSGAHVYVCVCVCVSCVFACGRTDLKQTRFALPRNHKSLPFGSVRLSRFTEQPVSTPRLTAMNQTTTFPPFSFFSLIGAFFYLMS